MIDCYVMRHWLLIGVSGAVEMPHFYLYLHTDLNDNPEEESQNGAIFRSSARHDPWVDRPLHDHERNKEEKKNIAIAIPTVITIYYINLQKTS